MASAPSRPGSAPSRPVPPSSRPPPPKRRNDFWYALLGLGFFAAAASLWMANGEEPRPPAPPVETVARANPIAEPELDLAPEPELAPEPAPGPVSEAAPAAAKKHRASPEPSDGWSCSGEIEVAKLTAVIDQNRAQVRTCYERRLKVNSILQGSLRLRIKVGAAGEVVQSQAGGSLRDAEVSACVRNLASQWRFPPPAGGRCAVVDAPFQFEPKPS